MIESTLTRAVWVSGFQQHAEQVGLREYNQKVTLSFANNKPCGDIRYKIQSQFSFQLCRVSPEASFSRLKVRGEHSYHHPLSLVGGLGDAGHTVSSL